MIMITQSVLKTYLKRERYGNYIFKLYSIYYKHHKIISNVHVADLISICYYTRSTGILLFNVPDTFLWST